MVMPSQWQTRPANPEDDDSDEWEDVTTSELEDLKPVRHTYEPVKLSPDHVYKVAWSRRGKKVGIEVIRNPGAIGPGRPSWLPAPLPGRTDLSPQEVTARAQSILPRQTFGEQIRPALEKIDWAVSQPATPIWRRQAGEIPESLGGIVRPHYPTEALRKKATEELATENIRQRELQQKLAGMSHLEAAEYYREMATPEERFIIEGLIPGIGFTPMPPVVKGVTAAARAGKAAIGKGLEAAKPLARGIGAEVGQRLYESPLTVKMGTINYQRPRGFGKELTPEFETAVSKGLKTEEDLSDAIDTYKELTQDALSRYNEMGQQIEGMKTGLIDDPVASFTKRTFHWKGRGLPEGEPSKLIGRDWNFMELLDEYGGMPETLTRAQAQMVKGRPVRQVVVNKQGRVPIEYVFDEIADDMGISEDVLIRKIQNAWKLRQQIKGLEQEQSGLKYALAQGQNELEYLEALQKQGLKPPEVQMAPGTSVQTGLPGMGREAAQARMFGEVRSADLAPSPLLDAEALKAKQVAKPLPGQAAMPEVPKAGEVAKQAAKAEVPKAGEAGQLSQLFPEGTDTLTHTQAFNLAKQKGIVKTAEEYKALLEKEGNAGLIEGGSGTSSKNARNKQLGALGWDGYIQKPTVTKPATVPQAAGVKEAAGRIPEKPLAPVVEPSGKIEQTFEQVPRSVTAGQISKSGEPATTTIGQAAWQYGTEPPRKPIWSDDEVVNMVANQLRKQEIGGIPPREPPPSPPTPSGAFPSGRKPGGPQNIKPTVERPAEELAKEALTPEVKSLRQRYETTKDKFLRAMSDRNNTLTALERETGIPTHQLAQVVPGATGAGENILRVYYNPIWKPLGKDVPELELYMSLMRDMDILARNPSARLPGGVPGWKGVTEALTSFKTRIGPERFQKIENTAKQLYDAHDRLTLQVLEDAGMLTPEAHTAIKSAHPHYIPFQRSDFTETFTEAFRRPEASVSKLNIEAMELAGSERKLDNPLARHGSQIITTQRLAFRNRAAKGIADALQEQEKLRGLEGQLVIPSGQPTKPGILMDTMSYFQDGKQVTVQVPKVFADIAKNLDSEPTNLLSLIGKYTAMPLAKGAVTYNPAFVVVNPLRDALSAFFREKLIPFSPDYFKGWISTILKDASYSEAAQSGVFMSGIVDTMRTTDAMKRAAMSRGIQVKNAKDALLVLPRLIERANITAEQATRLATFKKLRAQGIERLEATVRARDVTVDFAKSGTAMQVINQVIPFSNAGVQGSINVLRTFKHNPKWAIAAASAFAAPTIISRVNNMRFETSELIPDYEYTNNWVIQVSEGTKKDGTKFPIYIKIPKGQIGSILSFVPEALFNVARKTDNRSAVEMILSMGLEAAKTAAPVEPNISGILPPAFGTGVGLATNKEVYTGQSIIPRREESLLPEQQFGPETSKQAIALGKQFKISPRLIDFAIRDYTAGAGQTVNWLLSMGLQAAGYKPEPFGAETPKGLERAEEAGRVPVVSRFLGTKATQLERRGWEDFDRTADETNRIFAALPDMNRLGVRLGEVGSTVNKTELTPQQKTQFQKIMAEMVTPGMQAFKPEAGLTPDKHREAVQKEMGRLKELARARFTLETGLYDLEKADYSLTRYIMSLPPEAQMPAFQQAYDKAPEKAKEYLTDMRWLTSYRRLPEAIPQSTWAKQNVPELPKIMGRIDEIQDMPPSMEPGETEKRKKELAKLRATKEYKAYEARRQQLIQRDIKNVDGYAEALVRWGVRPNALIEKQKMRANK